jgi:CDP-6-deoxy-D-xylo-4-hexulose-3-dehydrase
MQNNIGKEDLEAVIELLSKDNPKLTHGPRVAQFEKEWSEWLGVKHSLMVNSGSSANDLTMLALKHLRGNGQVIVPPLTWVSDIASVLNAGLDPVFVDISPTTLAIDPRQVLAAITDQTLAVFVTHVLGYDGLDDFLV